MMRIQARHFETNKPVEILIQNEIISAVQELKIAEEEAADLPWVSPGFFDIQLNGYGGTWFSSGDLTADSAIEACHSLIDTGIAKFYPTLITASQEALEHGFRILEEACTKDDAVRDCVAGYHLEGPYISKEDGPRGAHPLQHVRSADWAEFQQLQAAANGRIRLVTLAAESPNAVEFIDACTSSQIVVSLGHMAADTDQISAAVEAGATLSTHLGNGAHGTLRRHPNYLWDQLAEDRLWASVIADGWHLPPSVLQCVLKCKSIDRMILTCDISGFAGCPPGVYSEGDVGVEVLSDGRLVVAGQTQFLAGSSATTGECIVHAMNACGLSLSQAVSMATENPCRLMGDRKPSLQAGQTATLTLFRTPASNNGADSSFQPVATIVKGQTRSR